MESPRKSSAPRLESTLSTLKNLLESISATLSSVRGLEEISAMTSWKSEHDAKESLLAVVADGTATNTGWKDGMIAHFERDLGRPLLWLICQLHGNELPLRHLFDQCDGGFGTSGPDSFKGPIGQACKGELHLLDTVKFEKIEPPLNDLDETVWKDLSQDQQLLYRWTKAIASGEVPQKLACTVIGGSTTQGG